MSLPLVAIQSVHVQFANGQLINPFCSSLSFFLSFSLFLTTRPNEHLNDQFSLQKPYKVWSCDRQTRKSVIASSLLELKLHGAEKLSFDESTAISEIKVVLEADGTEVEDDGYFQTAEKDTIFILLKPGETWLPLGVEALKSALSAIPGLVSEALNKLEASDKLPNWKVSDNNGIISVVLSWDTRDRTAESPLPDADIELLTVDQALGLGSTGPPFGPSTTSTGLTRQVSPLSAAQQQQQQHLQADQSSVKRTSAQSPPILKHTTSVAPSLLTSTSIPRGNLIGLEDLASQFSTVTSSRITRPEILPEIQTSFYTGTGETLAMEYDTDSDEDKTDQASPSHDHNHCDFHCSGIHRQIQIKKIVTSVATSPISESIVPFPPALVPRDGRSITPTSRRPGSKNVRFQDLEQMKKSNGSEDSDTETTDREEEQLCERYLLLVDQLAIGHERHLTVKDIGCILEKLSTKIVDVDKLERERESSDCHNWVIRALIRGESLREIGVVYNSQYFGIIEHPGYF